MAKGRILLTKNNFMTKINVLLFPNVREYTTKTNDRMIVISVLLLDTGELIEQHFAFEEIEKLQIGSDFYFKGQESPVYCVVTTEQKGFRNKITAVEYGGIVDFKLKA